MKSFLLTCICLLGLAFVTAARASDFEAALSSQTAQFTLRSDSSLIGWGGSDLAFSLFYNEDDDIIGQMSLMQMRQASQDTPLTFGVGVKAYVGQLDKPDEDVLALAIGGEVRYTIPGTMPMAVYARGFYAPEITSFSGSKEVKDYTFGFQIEALPQTVAFVGVRHFDIKTDAGNHRLDDNRLHVGVRLTF
jgi:hypothetical protein